MLRLTLPLRASTRRVAREAVFLPWNARPWSTYDTNADDWKFLDRALSAVVEMTPAEVSEKSQRLCPRHLLHEIEDPVEVLQRRRRLELQRTARQQQQRRKKPEGVGSAPAVQSEKPARPRPARAKPQASAVTDGPVAAVSSPSATSAPAAASNTTPAGTAAAAPLKRSRGGGGRDGKRAGRTVADVLRQVKKPLPDGSIVNV